MLIEETQNEAQLRSGLSVTRYYTVAGEDVWASVDWVERTASINDGTGGKVFEQHNVEAPATWSQLAINVVASKYFRGQLGTPEREHSVKQLIGRVVKQTMTWGRAGNYFASEADAAAFQDELTYLLLHQHMAFNSPVWFNLGWPGRKQASSACFINEVDDTMESILDLYKTQGNLFKSGAGSGANLSRLRSSKEPLAAGGVSSGPVSFMRGWDASAGSIKSGGATRRAALLWCLDVQHPDILEFIECKADAEKRAHALIDAGFPADFAARNSVYESVGYQNANNSIRVTDDFMRAVIADDDWDLKAVINNTVIETVKARDVLMAAAKAAWVCGDPGIQYDSTINAWHTVPQSGPIRGSNPCSEFMHLDSTACNLASLNLMKFVTADGAFCTDAFEHACRTTITAQEIFVGFADYPTEKIEQNSHDFRPLGLGYANLGAVLMSLGLAYDSDAGRAFAGAVTALMTGAAYAQSVNIAKNCGGPFAGYAINAQDTLRVLDQHRGALSGVVPIKQNENIVTAAQKVWDETLVAAIKYGVRNAQVSTCAPTGTIAFMMDCGTTGVEPDIALVKYKRLVGGGSLKLVNQTVPVALKNLQYTATEIANILQYIEDNGTIEGAPYVDDKHLSIFDCAFKADKGQRSIGPMGHVKMVSAVQPFYSGSISKCLVGDTVVFTDKGPRRLSSFYQAEQAPDSFRPLQDLNVWTRKGTEAVDAFYYNGKQQTVEVKFGSGYTITGTPDHKVLVAGGTELVWKRLADLAETDWVALKLGSNKWGTDPLIENFVPPEMYGSQHKDVTFPNKMTPELAGWLGQLTADGHTNKNNYVVGMTKNCDASRELFEKRAAALFRLPFRSKADMRNGVKQTTVGSKALLAFLDHIGFDKKRVPDCIMHSSKESVFSYISGFYQDGYVTASLSISQKHLGIIQDLQMLWANAGVRSYINDNIVDGVVYPVLHISSEDREKAAGLLHFTETHKIERAASVSDNDINVFPFPGIRERLKAAASAQGATQKHRNIFDKRTHNLRVWTVEMAMFELGVEVDRELFSYVYLPVRSVREGPITEVFDLSVPGSHSYVANGIVSHNTCNVPETFTPEDIFDIYVQAWRLGLKSIAVYRDGCKRSQPLSTTKQKEGAASATAVATTTTQHIRRRLPDERASITHKFTVSGFEGYLTVGLYEDGTPGELFVRMSKEGSTVSGLMDAIATSISIALQHGVALSTLVDKFSRTRFEPAGFTGNPDIPMTTSVIDYIFRWLALKFISPASPVMAGPTRVEHAPVSQTTSSDAPPCLTCGSITVRAGACYACPQCGTTTGCG